MKKLISAFAVLVAISAISGCGIKGKLYLEPEVIQQEDDSTEHTNEKNSKSENDSDEISKK